MTQYAMVDRDDDLKIGVKSTAILFGRYDKLIIGLLQLAALGLMALVGILLHLNGAFYWSLLLAGGLFVHQQKRLPGVNVSCASAFLNNNYVGRCCLLACCLIPSRLLRCSDDGGD